MKAYLQDYMTKLNAALASIDLDKVDRMVEMLTEAREAGRNIFVCGNGGSSATASHFAVDMTKGATYGRPSKPFRCISLGDCLPLTTALGNDIGYETVFSEAMRPFAQPGDVLLAISVSGNSPNVIEAVRTAREMGVATIGLCGGAGGKLADLADLALKVDDTHFGRAEDAHMVIIHLLCYAFMDNEPATKPRSVPR